MGTVSLPYTLTAGATENVAHVQANFEALRDEINGLLDAANIEDGTLTKEELASALADILGVSQTATVRRGKSIIATEETHTTGATYGYMPTPDRVESVVVPADGLILVSFLGHLKNSVASAGRIGLFLNDVQTENIFGATSEVTGISDLVYHPLYTTESGLNLASAASTDTAPPATGGQYAGMVSAFQVLAGGTYTVGVKVRATSGTVTMIHRRMRVWAMGF